jgi:hypothetical protein
MARKVIRTKRTLYIPIVTRKESVRLQNNKAKKGKEKGKKQRSHNNTSTSQVTPFCGGDKSTTY